MFTSSHSVHALATYLRTVCENMQKQVCQLGQSKRVIGREPYMWLGGLAGSLGCLVLITDLRIQPLCPRQVRASRTAASRHAWAVFTSSQVQYAMDAHLQGAAALHAPLSYKQHMDLISLILGCRRVIMFLCASRLPSFAPGHWPSRASRSQVTAGKHKC